MIIKAKRYELVEYQGVEYPRTITDGTKSLSSADKVTLDEIKAAIVNRQFNLQDQEFYNKMFEVDLAYMAPEELQAISDPRFVVGVDFRTIDTSPPFTSKEMNDMYPGSVNAAYWKTVFANTSLFWSRYAENVDTSLGKQSVIAEIYRNTGIEDMVSANTLAQGLNLQNIILSDKKFATNYRFRYNPVNNPIEFTYMEE